MTAAAPELVAPAYLWTPPHVSTAGRDAADLAALAGLDLDPEQRLALDAVLAEDERGLWAAFESVIVEPRQNGKTVDLQAIALHDAFLVDVRLLIWTAHLFETAEEAFRDLDQIIAGTPEFARRVKRVSRANGDEGFELENDRRIRFRARSKTGGRGLSGDTVIFDEAFALTGVNLGALLPTLAARPNPHVIYASSAGMVESEHLRALRDRGRPGGDPSLAYVEWCAPGSLDDCASPRCDHRAGTTGCVLDDEERLQQANPALGRRISLRVIRAERRGLPPDEYAREFFGWWDEPALGAGSIPEDAWRACADRDAVIAEPCTLGFDVAPGHLSAAIVVAGGALHVTDQHAGTSWIVPRLVELGAEHDVAAVAFDPTGPAGALIPELEAAGFVIRSAATPKGLLVALDGREASQACEAFLAAVVSRTLVHRDEGALNGAVELAARRQVGDSWRWSRRDTAGDISPLVAATLARWVRETASTLPHVAGDVDQAAYEAALAQITEQELRARESLESE